MPDIFTYLDYRRYLHDCYTEKKARNPNFSHRYIAEKASLKSTGHFSLILQGKVNISTALIPRLAAAFSLARREADYFEAMVLFNQARSLDERKRYFERVIALRGSRPAPVDAGQYEFYTKWYYTAVREAIAIQPCRGDFTALARFLSPHITPAEAREAVELLERLGLISREPDGTFRKAEITISTGYNAPGVAIDAFHADMMRLAAEAIDRHPRERRNLSTVTVSISEREYREIIDELRAFRRRILAIASGADKADRIYQFNFQVFPLSAMEESGEIPAPAHSEDNEDQ